MSDEALFSEFRTLLVKAFEGDISPEEADRINDILTTVEGAYAYYRNFLDISLALHEVNVDMSVSSVRDHKFWSELATWEQTAPVLHVEPSPSPEEKEPLVNVRPMHLPRQKISRLSLVTLVLSSAAMLFIMLFVRFAPTHASVAYCRQTLNAKWLNAPLREGDLIHAETLSLVEGFAEIVLNSGVEIVLESPVEIRIDHRNQVYLQRGRLTASIQNSTEDTFVVRTPGASIVDFGTEFGLEVDEYGDTQTHVFKGAVQVRSGPNPLKFDNALSLTAGQSARAEASGTIRSIRYQPQMFTRQEQLDVRLQAAKGSGLYRWKAYNLILDKDPSLVGHYTFERNPASPDILANAAPAFTSLTGILGQDRNRPDWTEGRWPGKTALQFDRGKNQKVIIPAAEELAIGGPITLAVWVRVQDIHAGGHILCCRDDFEINYQLGWFGSDHQYPGHRNRIQFFRYSQEPSEKAEMFSSEVVLNRDTWHHIAVTHDNRQITYYLDGDVVSTSPYVFENEPFIADVVIGDLDAGVSIYARHHRNRFHGEIDEVIILRRAMDAVEIARMYQAGKP